MSADAPTDEPLPDAYESIQDAAFKIMAYVELGLAGITLLALFVSWVYVLLHSRRRLSTLRFLLTMTCGLWVSGLVASHRALWMVLDDLVNLNDVLGSWDRDELCGYHTCITLGFAEPASLLLIAALIRSRTLKRDRTCTRRWLARRSLAVAFVVAVVQTGLVLFPLLDLLDNQFTEPRPPLLTNSSDATKLDYNAWWREEGCANTIASVFVDALFVFPFEAYWALACYRLLGLIINLKLKRRLLYVQVAYTLVPICLLLIRFTLLLYDSNWDIGRRLMRDVELVLALFACIVAVRFVIFRPVHEMVRANAPLAGFDGDDGDSRPKGRMKARAKRRVGAMKLGAVKPTSSRPSGAAVPSIRRPSWDVCPPVDQACSTTSAAGTEPALPALPDAAYQPASSGGLRTDHSEVHASL